MLKKERRDVVARVLSGVRLRIALSQLYYMFRIVSVSIFCCVPLPYKEKYSSLL